MLEPTMLYAKELTGIGSIVEGGVTLNYIIVDKDDVEDAVSQGWIVSLQDALSGKELILEVEADEVAEAESESEIETDEVSSQVSVRTAKKKVK